MTDTLAELLAPERIVDVLEREARQRADVAERLRELND
jgi:hypothetical protein